MSQGYKLPEGHTIGFEYYRPKVNPIAQGLYLPFTKGGRVPSGLLVAQEYRRLGWGYPRYQKGISDWEPGSNGGLVCCFIRNGNGELIAGGEAWCHPRDVFNYRIGRDISRGRALKALANGGA